MKRKSCECACGEVTPQVLRATAKEGDPPKEASLAERVFGQGLQQTVGMRSLPAMLAEGRQGRLRGGRMELNRGKVAEAVLTGERCEKRRTLLMKY